MTQKEIVDRWLEEIQKDLIKNYEKTKRKASGRWAKSLEPFSEEKNDVYRIGILGEEYTGALEKPGRKPTSKSKRGRLWGVIRKWVDDKGIKPNGISKDSLAFLIARKIDREGIKVPNKYNKGGLVSDVVTKKRVDQLVDEIGLFYQAELKSSLLKTIR